MKNAEKPKKTDPRLENLKKNLNKSPEHQAIGRYIDAFESIEDFALNKPSKNKT